MTLQCGWQQRAQQHKNQQSISINRTEEKHVVAHLVVDTSQSMGVVVY